MWMQIQSYFNFYNLESKHEISHWVYWKQTQQFWIWWFYDNITYNNIIIISYFQSFVLVFAPRPTDHATCLALVSNQEISHVCNVFTSWKFFILSVSRVTKQIFSRILLCLSNETIYFLLVHAIPHDGFTINCLQFTNDENF